MPTPPSVWAHAGFALGYAEDGVFPIPLRAEASCLAAQESTDEQAHPAVVTVVTEAGRKEGRRAARAKGHVALYGYHASVIDALLAPVLKRIDSAALIPDLLATAAHQAGAGTAATERHRVVAAAALVAIRAAMTSDERHQLDKANADGWAHAHAQGSAEAQATPDKGGPPDPKKVAALATTALASVPTTVADQVGRTWTSDELASAAMGIALAAGDGAATAEASRKIAQALVDTGRATRTYANGLHQVVMTTYLDQITAANPGRTVNFVTAGNPCPTCLEIEGENPWDPLSVPVPPVHFNCQCHLELATQPALVMADAT